jgi:class 3 adenylate cyclase
MSDDRNREKDPYSKIRHDLRTPINQIIGYSELLEEEAEDAGQSGLVPDLRKIQQAARRQLSMIDEFFSPGSAPDPPARRPEPEPRPPDGDSRPALDATETIPPPVLTGGFLSSASLLVVDDNEMNRDMLSRRLEARGYSVATAEDGYRALERVGAGGFDLVLLDVMMPGLSGLDVLRSIREKSSRADLPVIMATAKDSSEDVVEALKLGANDYVTKPLDFPVVLARVQSALSLKHATDEIQRLAQHLEVRNQFIRNTFGRYLSDEVVESLLETPEGLELGGERRTVTILMSDLRGFSSLAERLAPEQVVSILNNYLARMADVIMKHRGTIDEFIGDAILVIFGAPVVRADDAQRGVACAAEMQRAMESVNAFNRERGLPEVEMGIAVHTGEVVVGNIGSQRRAKYGVVGTTVNLTSRIETYTVGGQVLVSESAVRAAGEVVQVGAPIQVKAKGAREPVLAYDLRGVGGAFDVSVPVTREVFRRVEPGVPVRFFVVEGKHVGETEHRGSLLRLSQLGAEVDAPEEIAALTNLKLHVTGKHGTELEGEVYAKVVVPQEACHATFTIRFTSRSPEVASYLARAYEAGS